MNFLLNFKLIDKWRSFWRFWSLRFTAIGIALLTWVANSPDVVLDAWNNLPQELKQIIPQNYLLYITIAIFLLGAFSRIVKQEKLSDSKDKDGTN